MQEASVEARLAVQRHARACAARGTKRSSEQFLSDMTETLINLAAETRSEKDNADSFKKMALAMEKQAKSEALIAIGKNQEILTDPQKAVYEQKMSDFLNSL